MEEGQVRRKKDREGEQRPDNKKKGEKREGDEFRER